MKGDRREAIAATVGIGGSLLVHGLVLLLVSSVQTAPQLEFEFELPAEVEFGLTEEMEAAEGASSAAASQEPVATTEGGEGPGTGADGGVDAAPPDAGVADAGVDAGWDAGFDAGFDAASLVATTEGEGESETETEAQGDEGEGEASEPPENLAGPARIPPGAQIAIRLDMDEVRRSPLAPEARRLLAAIPDWHLVLAGSGIDPLDDLDRLLLASPNLQRSRLVIAGRHTHADESGDGHEYIRTVVQRFGEARGQPTPWRRRHGVQVANWPNEDTTRRVLAIVGPRHFTITRPQDLQRTLSIARAREERGDDEDEEDLETAEGPDALLSMGPGDAFTVEVEGARRFVRSGNTSLIPARLRLAIRSEGGGLLVRGVATFDDAAQAEAAYAYWNRERERAARSTMVRLMGLNSALGEGLLEVDGASVRVQGPLTEAQGRLVLGYLEGMVRRPRRRGRNGARPNGMRNGMRPSGMRPNGPNGMESMAPDSTPETMDP